MNGDYLHEENGDVVDLSRILAFGVPQVFNQTGKKREKSTSKKLILNATSPANFSEIEKEKTADSLHQVYTQVLSQSDGNSAAALAFHEPIKQTIVREGLELSHAICHALLNRGLNTEGGIFASVVLPTGVRVVMLSDIALHCFGNQECFQVYNGEHFFPQSPEQERELQTLAGIAALLQFCWPKTEIDVIPEPFQAVPCPVTQLAKWTFDFLPDIITIAIHLQATSVFWIRFFTALRYFLDGQFAQIIGSDKQIGYGYILAYQLYITTQYDGRISEFAKEAYMQRRILNEYLTGPDCLSQLWLENGGEQLNSILDCRLINMVADDDFTRNLIAFGYPWTCYIIPELMTTGSCVFNVFMRQPTEIDPTVDDLEQRVQFYLKAFPVIGDGEFSDLNIDLRRYVIERNKHCVVGCALKIVEQIYAQVENDLCMSRELIVEKYEGKKTIFLVIKNTLTKKLAYRPLSFFIGGSDEGVQKALFSPHIMDEAFIIFTKMEENVNGIPDLPDILQSGQIQTSSMSVTPNRGFTSTSTTSGLKIEEECRRQLKRISEVEANRYRNNHYDERGDSVATPSNSPMQVDQRELLEKIEERKNSTKTAILRRVCREYREELFKHRSNIFSNLQIHIFCTIRFRNMLVNQLMPFENYCNKLHLRAQHRFGDVDGFRIATCEMGYPISLPRLIPRRAGLKFDEWRKREKDELASRTGTTTRRYETQSIVEQLFTKSPLDDIRLIFDDF